MKGCGKRFMWIKYLNDERICGQIEDLKHSDHIILCPECSDNSKTKPIILDDNEVSLSMYAEEYPENWKKISESSPLTKQLEGGKE
jgi:hypothetical protein